MALKAASLDVDSLNALVFCFCLRMIVGRTKVTVLADSVAASPTLACLFSFPSLLPLPATYSLLFRDAIGHPHRSYNSCCCVSGGFFGLCIPEMHLHLHLVQHAAVVNADPSAHARCVRCETGSRSG